MNPLSTSNPLPTRSSQAARPAPVTYTRPQLERLGAWQFNTGIGGSATQGLDRYILPDAPNR